MSDQKSDPTGLLTRWLDDIAADEILVVDPPSLDEARSLLLSTQRAVRFFCHDFATHRALDDFGLLSEFGAWLPAERADGVVLYLPKGREFTAMVIAKFAGWLDEHAPFWLVGPKRGGIGPARAALGEWSVIDGVESGRHCKLIRALAVDAPSVELDDFALEWGFEVRDTEIRVVSFPGVFGHGRLDAGTELLLETVQNLKSPLADFGAGCGAIGAYYARLGSEGVLLESNALALEACRRTVRANRIAELEVRPSDVLSALDGTVKTILSNPPFHKGFQTDHSITSRLISTARDELRRNGTMTLVCNCHLSIRDQLAEAFGTYKVLAETTKFRVYQVGR